MSNSLPLFSDPSRRAFLRASDPAFKLKNARWLAGIFVIACIALAARAQTPANAGNIPATPTTATMDPTKPARPGVLTSADPNTPPPFVSVAGDPNLPAVAADAATAAISPALRARTDAAHADWVKTQGGAEFHPDLAYVGGHPILMLVTMTGESAAVQSRRLKATVDACGLLLQDEAFDRATICIATYNPARPDSMATRNTPVSRDTFHSEVTKTGQSPVVASALAVIRRDDVAIRQLCAALGLQ